MRAFIDVAFVPCASARGVSGRALAMPVSVLRVRETTGPAESGHEARRVRARKLKVGIFLYTITCKWNICFVVSLIVLKVVVEVLGGMMEG